MREGSLLRSWLLGVAVLWPALFIILGLIGDFAGPEVARSFLFAVAISTGTVLGQSRRRRSGG